MQYARMKLMKVKAKAENVYALMRYLQAPVCHAFRSLGLPLTIRFVNHIITWKCNSRCVMCNIWKKDPSAQKELQIDEIENLFADPLLSKLEWIQLSGGEPFLRKDIAEIVHILLKFHPKLTIYISTNGMLPNAIDSFLIKTREYHDRITIGISVDAIGSLHDFIRGIPGAFQRVMETTEVLRKYPAININVNMTVMPINYKAFPHVKRFAREYGASFGFQIAQVSTYFSNIEKIGNIVFHPLLFKDAVKLILKELDLHKLKPSSRFDLKAKLYYSIAERNQIIPCFSGFHSFALDPESNIFPCLPWIGYSEGFGNIREKPLKENGKVIKQRESVKR
jgi:MoaA/NifB/PqqE/SkfB family radical SAM enzyme